MYNKEFTPERITNLILTTMPTEPRGKRVVQLSTQLSINVK